MYYYGIQVGEHFSTVSLVEVGMQLAKIYWLIWVVFSIQGILSQTRPHFIKNTLIEHHWAPGVLEGPPGHQVLCCQDRAQVPGAPGQGGRPAGQHGPWPHHQYPYGVRGPSYSKDDPYKPSRWREEQGHGELNRAELSSFLNGFISVLQSRNIPWILTNYHAWQGSYLRDCEKLCGFYAKFCSII